MTTPLTYDAVYALADRLTRPGVSVTAVNYAKANKGAPFPVDTCLMQVRKAFGINAKYPTAYAAWLGAGGPQGANTHTTHYAVQDMPIFMKGAGAAGHICIYDTDGYVYTTDYPKRGQWNRVKLATLAKAWNMRILGGSETLNGVRVLPHKTF